MNKELKYNEHSANTSDHDCTDGDLALSLGLVLEDGALKPTLPPKVIMTLSEGEVVKYIHETSSICHYIILKSSGVLSWRTLSSSTQTTLRTFSNEIYGINAIGNTLVVLADDGMHYFLWNGDTDGYLYLGTQFPELPISFGLQTELVRSDEDADSDAFVDSAFSVYLDDGTLSSSISAVEFSEDDTDLVTATVLAKVNKFIAEESTGSGKFIFPFFVRYAYRLYDSSLIMHSAPILMVAATGTVPFVHAVDSYHGYDYATVIRAYVTGAIHSLDYAVVNQDDITSLENWSDIISSVDIFISAPIYTYDQNGDCERIVAFSDIDNSCICKHTNQATSTTTYPQRYQRNSLSRLYEHTFAPDSVGATGTPDQWVIELPARDEEDIISDLESCSLFYFLKKIDISELATERTLISISDDYLDSLVTREVMTDDYDSHDLKIPKFSFSYNSRLNIANLNKQFFQGFNPSSAFTYSDGLITDDASPVTLYDGTREINVYVYIKQDGQNIIVKADAGQLAQNTSFNYVYYPNTNAYKAIVTVDDFVTSTDDSTTSIYYELALEPHSFLNGALYMGALSSFNLANTGSVNVSTSSDLERTIAITNKVYTSEVDNPYYFPVLNINTVGTGEIIGISAAAKALSQGQFGSFPLYAFSTEGIWALEVSDTGTYSAKQTITRDVCINSDSITQIDSAVLFATDRGIMLISGSQTQCISDILFSEDPFTIADLPNAEKLISIYNDKASSSEQIVLADITLMPFKEFISECQMVYDYVHQRIVVYNPSANYAYVYSLKSSAWGMMQSNISSGVNSYPEALAMTDENKLVDFSDSDNDNVMGLIVTRPFKIDDPNMFKTINTIIQRGYCKNDNISQVLYGSNDLFNWFTIWSSGDKYLRGFRGSPYKAFRLVVFCDFGKDESLSGCSIQYTPRLTNQLR